MDLPLVDGHIFQRCTAESHACVVEEQIEPAESIAGRREQRFYSNRIADISRQA